MFAGSDAGHCWAQEVWQAKGQGSTEGGRLLRRREAQVCRHLGRTQCSQASGPDQITPARQGEVPGSEGSGLCHAGSRRTGGRSVLESAGSAVQLRNTAVEVVVHREETHGSEGLGDLEGGAGPERARSLEAFQVQGHRSSNIKNRQEEDEHRPLPCLFSSSQGVDQGRAGSREAVLVR